MSEGTLGFLLKASSQVYRRPVLDSLSLQVRTLWLFQTCMAGLPAQDRQAKLWKHSGHVRSCLWAAWGSEQLGMPPNTNSKLVSDIIIGRGDLFERYLCI